MAKRVLVGMSGGMDSAVAAALLKTQGYEVVGLHLQMWDRAEMGKARPGGSCVAMVDPDSVAKLCGQLEIPFHVVSAREQFHNEVIDLFVHEALNARSPNPCVRCNCRVKIPGLIKKADELHCDLVATGHYAKIVRNNDNTETNIYRATDRVRDQSYYLFELTQAQLARTIMPLGDLLESNVHKMAKTFKLPVAPKAATQKICFVDDPKYPVMIERSCPERYRPAGPVVDRDGRTLSRHSGLFRHHIGENRLVVTERPEDANLTVLAFDVKLNAVIVGDPKELFKAGVVATNCNWIGVQDFSRGMKARAKMRAQQPEDIDCSVTLLNNNSVLVHFNKPQAPVIPGQAIVFYQEDIMVGGGWIESPTDPSTTKMNKRQAFTSGP